MKKILAVVAVAAFSITGLTSCATGKIPKDADGNIEVTEPNLDYAPDTSIFVQELPNGEKVLCIWASTSKKGGLSCDWDGSRSASKK